ncbi:MAG: hypothetical protein V2A65_08005 [Candidatus Omnitrophota bacterium]
MAQEKQHLDIDLGFLDKVDSSKAEATNRKNTASALETESSKNRSKPIFIFLGIVFCLALLFFSIRSGVFSRNNSNANINSSNYTVPTTNQAPSYSSEQNDNNSNAGINTGSYPPTTNQTSDYSSNQNDSVIIGQYRLSKEQLDAEKQELTARSVELDKLLNQIKNTQVGQTDQVSIDNYNKMVDNYNREVKIWLKTKDEYNAKVDAYNNYLRANGTKIR